MFILARVFRKIKKSLVLTVVKWIFENLKDFVIIITVHIFGVLSDIELTTCFGG